MTNLFAKLTDGERMMLRNGLRFALIQFANAGEREIAREFDEYITDIDALMV